MKRIILLLFFLAATISVSAQKEATWWYFGYAQGLDFTKVLDGTAEMPTRICNGPIIQTEGVFSISDSEGNFLMASNGQKIYGRDREEMTGSKGGASTDMWGCGTSTQSGIVVPYPGVGNENKYYIFTVDCREHTAFRNPIAYTIVDMDLGETTADGSKRGDIVAGEKNIGLKFLDASGTVIGVNSEIYENITAIPHTNGIDYWVVTRTKRGFYSWHITPNGVNQVPNHLAANFGPNSGFNPTAPQQILGGDGHIRATPDGKSIICMIPSNSGSGNNQGNLTYVDFNAETGGFSKLKVLATGNRPMLGLDFSPDGKYIYFTQSYLASIGIAGVFRITTDYIKDSGDTTLATTTPILPADTTTQILDNKNPTGVNAQLGPNGWLYMIQRSQPNLWVIKKPGNNDIEEVKKSIVSEPLFFDGCGIDVTNGSPVNRVMGSGLPTFMPSFFNMGEPEADDYICKNANTTFKVIAEQGTGASIADYLEWNMGDKDVNPTILKTGEGTWPTGNIHITPPFKYEEAGVYTIIINPRKNNGDPIPGDNQKKLVIEIMDCVIPINPHLRGKMDKK